MQFTKDASPQELRATRTEAKSPTTPKKSVGDMYFDSRGTPYINCMICEQPVKYIDALTQKVTKHLGYKKEYRSVLVKGVFELKEIFIPRLQTGFGCFRCWDHQQRSK